MENFAGQASYVKRLTRVTSYIYDHLDEDLDLQVLAEVAALSPFHWHRIYHALYGETVAATVKRLRLQRAAAELARTSMSIEEIATRSAYETVASFNRAFKVAFGLPPAQFRREGSHARFDPRTTSGATMMYEVTVVDVPKTHLAVIDHVGPYMMMGKAFDRLYATLGSRNLINGGMRSIAVFFDDPTVVPEAALRSQAGIAIDKGFPVEAPLERGEIRGGPCALLKHTGPYSDMKAAYDWLYGEWLPQSGREPADAPAFEEYLNDPRNTPAPELRTNIYLPLR